MICLLRLYYSAVQKGGKTIEAVAQVTKMGMVFLFDRVTGEPVFPIEKNWFLHQHCREKNLGYNLSRKDPVRFQDIFSDSDIIHISDLHTPL